MLATKQMYKHSANAHDKVTLAVNRAYKRIANTRGEATLVTKLVAHDKAGYGRLANACDEVTLG